MDGLNLIIMMFNSHNNMDVLSTYSFQYPHLWQLFSLCHLCPSNWFLQICCQTMCTYQICIFVLIWETLIPACLRITIVPVAYILPMADHGELASQTYFPWPICIIIYITKYNILNCMGICCIIELNIIYYIGKYIIRLILKFLICLHLLVVTCWYCSIYWIYSTFSSIFLLFEYRK